MKGFYQNEIGRVYIDANIINRLCILPELSLSSELLLPNGPVSSEPSEQVARKGTDRYVHVDFTTDGQVVIDLRLLIRYGPTIHSSAASFQEKLVRRIEATTGLTVSRVDVKIDGIFRSPDQLPALEGPSAAAPAQLESQ